MASLYEVMQGVQLTADDLVEAESFVVQVLQAKYPDMDLRDGTAARDLVVRPGATLVAMVDRALDLIKANDRVSEIDDTTSEEFVNKLMSNWFMERQTGELSTLSARLYFAKPKLVVIPSSVFFSPDNTLKFYPSTSVSKTASSFSLDSASGEYYFDIDLVSGDTGTEYNISQGSLLYYNNFDPYFLRAEINYLASPSTAPETNLEFLARSKNAISTRNLINAPSITERITATFTDVSDITVVGHGDPLMHRDSVTIYSQALSSNVRMHIGGMIDIYPRTELKTDIVQVTLDANGKGYINGPIYRFNRSEISGGESADTVSYWLDAKAATWVSSIGNVVTLSIPNHILQVKDEILVSGSSISDMNGYAVVSAVVGNNVSFDIGVAAGSNPTGSIQVQEFNNYSWRILAHSDPIPCLADCASGSLTIHSTAHGMTANRMVKVYNTTKGVDYGWVRITHSYENSFIVDLGFAAGTFTGDSIAYVGVFPELDDTFSDSQSIEVNYGSYWANGTASFTIEYFDRIEAIQTYLDSDSARVVCNDPRVRGYNVYKLDVGITSYDNVAPDSYICKTAIQNYLKSITPGSPFIMSDMVSKLSDNGIKTIKTPVDVSYTLYTRDWIDPVTKTTVDVIYPADATCIFVLDNVSVLKQEI